MWMCSERGRVWVERRIESGEEGVRLGRGAKGEGEGKDEERKR